MIYSQGGGELMILTNDDVQSIGSLIEPLKAVIDDVKQGYVSVSKKIDSIESVLHGLIGRINGVESRLDGIESRLDAAEIIQSGFSKELRVINNSLIRIELALLPKVTAALDGISALNEKNDDFDAQINTLKNKTEKNNIKIIALEHIAKSSNK
jgi:archaellum component FlaC